MVVRQWMGIPSYSTSRGGVRLIVVHGTAGATTIQSLYNFTSNPANQASYHCAADNHAQNRVAEYVKRHHSAWGQAAANSVSICCAACVPAGAENWARDYWLSRQGWVLDSIASWIAEEARAYGLPIVKLSASQAQGTGRGVCGHADLGGWGSGGQGRSDPGYHFPWDYVLARASGGKPPASSTPPATGTAPRLSVDYFGQAHNSRVADVRTWQARMRERGWALDVDQVYGPGSERVCRQFQAEKRIAVDGLVGPNTWAAAWSAAVT